MLVFAHVSFATEVVLQEHVPNRTIIERVLTDHLQNLFLVDDVIVGYGNSIGRGQAQSALWSLRTIAKYASVIFRYDFFISDSFPFLFL